MPDSKATGYPTVAQYGRSRSNSSREARWVFAFPVGLEHMLIRLSNDDKYIAFIAAWPQFYDQRAVHNIVPRGESMRDRTKEFRV